MSWPIHRIATSQRYTDPLHVIETEWTLADVWDANDVLDELERVEFEATQKR
ncbi:MAG TPA: hypothetical protein VLT45_13200 [Kofleriaceae bacterium]|nr:hypothetical protein [Kofleriaceae bacterium]